MAWNSLANNQWVSRSDLQDAINTGHFVLKPGQSIPGTETNRWVTRTEVETWTNAIVTSGASNQWPQKSWLITTTTAGTTTTTTTTSSTTTTTTLATTTTTLATTTTTTTLATTSTTTVGTTSTTTSTSTTTLATTTTTTTVATTTTTTTVAFLPVQGFQSAGATCDYNNFPTTKYISIDPPRQIYDDSGGSTLTTLPYMINLPGEGFIRNWSGDPAYFFNESNDSISTIAYPSSSYARPRTTTVTSGTVTGQRRYVKVDNATNYQVTIEITSSTNTAIQWTIMASTFSSSGTNLVPSPVTYSAVVGTYTANFTANTCQSVDARCLLQVGNGDGVVDYTVKVEQI